MESDFFAGGDYEIEENVEEDDDFGDYDKEFTDKQEEQEFGFDFKQSQHVSSGKLGGSDTTSKLSRTPRDSAIIQVSKILEEEYEISTKAKNSIVDRIDKIPKPQLYNMKTMILAALFIQENKTLKELSKFHNNYKTKNVDITDLLRYIRFLREMENENK